MRREPGKNIFSLQLHPTKTVAGPSGQGPKGGGARAQGLGLGRGVRRVCAVFAVWRRLARARARVRHVAPCGVVCAVCAMGAGEGMPILERSGARQFS